VTSEKRVVNYYYQLEHKSGAEVAEIITDLERSISSVILRKTRFFPECNGRTSDEENVDEQIIVGMSTLPTDRVLSFCGDSCAIIEGRLTVYISPSQARRTRSRMRQLSSVDEAVDEILSSVKNSMSDGELNSANPNIVRVTYLEPGDGSILTGDVESENDKPSDTPAQKSIPAYGYALLATSATLVVVASAIAIRNRNTKNLEKEEEDENDVDEEDAISLEDDGSTGCLDMSTTTSDRVFIIWKNMNSKNRANTSKISVDSKGSHR
jgi:hypothetical protein